MRHRILTCLNHPELRWSCKNIAWSEPGGYNGCRNLSFCGTPSNRGMFSDGSGLDCDRVYPDGHEHSGKEVLECLCKVEFLILAPEDTLVTR